MKAYLTTLIAVLSISVASWGTTINVNVVGWSYLNPSYDTTITAAPGDTLIIFNATTGFIGFFKEINNVRVDTLPGVAVGDTADVHVLNWNHNYVGYYIHTQVYNEYGLRCTINFLNAGVGTSTPSHSLFMTMDGIQCNTTLSGVMSVYTTTGELVLQQSISAGENRFGIGAGTSMLIAELRLNDGSVIRKKFIWLVVGNDQ